CARPETPVDFLWGSHLAAGTVSAVVSKPKVGKSTFARNLCLAVARGEDFLGLRTKQGECIYLALEEREDDVRNDFRAMGASGNEPILIHAAAAPADGIVALYEVVKTRKRAVVVIDPLFRFARVKDESAYAEVYNALGPLIDIARESGTHVMVLHHSGKGIGKADPIDSPLGSTAIGGAVSTLIVLRRTEAYRTIQTVQRVGQSMPETVLNFDSEARRLSIGGTREEAETENLTGEILEFLRGAGEPRIEPEITEAVEGKTKFVRRALRQLVKLGKVSREGGGRRGDPFKYGFSFSCSHYIPGTREQETEKTAHTRMNAESVLVPGSEQKSFLVPANREAPKTPGLTPETDSDAIEV
ncbi:MAG: helicase RepA family protein, partial [Acidobacteria bacterium]|nr:helicase RepA family protein [Acidobacteriota bacterium]